MGMLDMATYTQLQAADAMRDAAQNPSGGAGLTAGIGAGMGIGNLMQQATSGAMQGQQAGGGAKAAAGILRPLDHAPEIGSASPLSPALSSSHSQSQLHAEPARLAAPEPALPALPTPAARPTG